MLCVRGVRGRGVLCSGGGTWVLCESVSIGMTIGIISS